jgi:hypothetical protein
MNKKNLVLVGVSFLLGASFILLLSVGKKTTYTPTNKGGLTNTKLSNYSDTIFQNDSIFTVLLYKEGKVKSMTLRAYIGQRRDRSYDIHTINFFENGKLSYLNTSYRDTTIENGSVYYEEQTLSFNEKNNGLRHFTIMDDFKTKCKKSL